MSDQLLEALQTVRNTVGDLKNGFATFVKPEHWVNQLQHCIDDAIRKHHVSTSDRLWDDSVRGQKMSDVTGRTIFKYQMPVQEEFTMHLPKDAEIIRVQDQDGMFWLWAVVDTEAELEERYFRAFKTGAKMPDGIKLKYIGFCAVFVQQELGLYLFEEII